jgi:uracil-DNA glycosylase
MDKATLEKLITPAWAEYLPKAGELLEPIREQLRQEKQLGLIILPERERIFRVFHEIPPAKVSVLWIGQDPYHNPPGQATGRAFECGKHPSPSWRKITEIYKKEVAHPDPYVIQGRLDHWANQGVFMLNKALTVRHRMPNSHTRFWEPFTRYVIGAMLTDLNPKAVVILGAEANKMVSKVMAPHKSFYYEHPAAASYQGRPWKGDGLFKEVSHFLSFYEKEINW